MNSSETALIQPIDRNIASKICSGQVVLNLATAVKELVENSIDAGATCIQVKLVEYGSKVIEVIDDGCGVDEANFQGLTLKHYTSKITEFADLYNVETFGFRGEALSSLCSLSDVTIVTQHKNASIGATLKFDHNGIITSNVKTKRKTGTTVRLENLFNTLPIRRTEFLRNLKREFGKMCNVLYAYGLQSSGTRILCTNSSTKSKLNSKEAQVDSTKPSTYTTIMDIKGESVESNIISIFGTKQKQNLLKFKPIHPTEETLKDFGLENKKVDFNKFQLCGYISSCSHGCGRAASDRQFIYVNSRPTDNVKICKVINEVYHQYNNRQDPFVVLNIKVESGYFDMNLTPDKRQILIQDENFLLAIVKESLHGLFKNIPSTLQMQNLTLSKNIKVQSESVSFQDRLSKFRANTKTTSTTNQEVTNKLSSVDKSPKFSLPKKSGCSNTSKIEEPFEIVIRTESLTKEPKTPEKKVNGPEETHKLPSEEKLESMVQESFVEITPQAAVVKEIIELKRPSESVFIESDSETEMKRIKLDCGLVEEDKNKRKEVVVNACFSDVKKFYLENKISDDIEFDHTKVKFLADITPQNNERAENELKKQITKDSFGKMEIIGQFNLGFIIARLGPDLFIIDQHASDEKYNFETLQATTVLQVQNLFNPEQLELTVDKEELILQHRDVFKRNGFEFSFDEEKPATKRVSLKAIPFSKNVVFGKEDIDELLFLLEKAPELKNIRPSKVDSILASRACRKSVMIGTPLDNQEMKKIVEHMGTIEQPWNCPHGRPTMRHLVNLSIIHFGK